MSDPDWAQIKQIVADALERPAETRGAFIAEACRGSASVRAEVESLLAAHDASPGFIETGAEIPSETLAILGAHIVEPGARIGPYRVLRSLGTGGMGTVYLA